MPKSWHNIRILVVFPHQSTGKESQASSIRKALLEHAPEGYRLDVHLAQLPKSSNFRQYLIQAVCTHKSHLVILADTLVDYTRESLHEWNECLKPARCLLLTRDRIPTRRAMFASLEHVIPISIKALLQNTKLVMKDCICRLYNQTYQGGLEIADNKNVLSHTEFDKEEVKELLERLFPHEQQLSVDILPWKTSDRFRNLEQSLLRPRSVLLSVERKNHVPVIVKIARRESIEVEVERYYKYIEGRLIGLRHTHILRHETVWNTGGIVYSLIGTKTLRNSWATSVSLSGQTGYSQPQPLSQWILDDSNDEKRSKKLAGTIKELYGSVLSLLHSTIIPYEDRIPSLFEQYNEAWSKPNGERKWEEELRSLLDPFDPYWQPHLRHFVGIPSPLPNPVYWVWQNKSRSLLLDVTIRSNGHGDVHSENILVDNDGYCWLLDFERSGTGPALQDYVELEIDLLTRLAVYEGNLRLTCAVALIIVDFPDFNQEKEEPVIKNYEMFRMWPTIYRALFLIEALRTPVFRQEKSNSFSRAYQTIIDEKEYLWGLLLNTVFILGQSVKHGYSLRAEYAAIFGGIICLRLEQLHANRRSPWPPSELMFLFHQLEND